MGKPMTMIRTGDQLTDYARHLKARGLAPSTIDAYTGWLRRLDGYAHGLDDADADTLECWVAMHDWAPNSHQKAVQSVRYYYRWLQATGRRDDDPSATLRPARSPQAIPDPCDEGRYRTALDAAHGQDWWRLRLAAETGMRRAELARCHSDHVCDLVTGPALLITGKGRRKRWVPLPDDLAAWLRMQRGFVFPARDGGHMTPPGVGNWYARRLGTHVHSLRHRYATLAYHHSHDINATRTLLGHSSVATTMVYVQVADEDLKAAASGAWAA